MLAAGGSWLYSPTTLSVVTALGTLLAGLAAVWVLLVAGPRYRLRYGPLKSRRLGPRSWEVDIYLSSRGRRDITRQAFDQDDPLTIDIGAPIVEVNRVWSSHKTLRIVTHHTDGTRLLVGPGLIGRRQDLRFTVTAKARAARPICQASLIDVRIRRQFLTPWGRYRVITYGSYGLLVIVNSLLYFLLYIHGIPLNPWVSFGLGGIVGLAIAIWANLRFRTPLDTG